ncbi:Macrophage mannose receptor 1 [Oryzias melastigma]|uniref:Macrophage mannose receptor 1 n=1 Tax=Oryzias melastigma TaxID=30732 RepID=A0A834FRD6_ORYME|nr:Macrophage mannose receptor 1 [Oryzias melastigma]
MPRRAAPSFPGPGDGGGVPTAHHLGPWVSFYSQQNNIMEEKILLLVLVFSDIFILSSCLHTRQYYYVNQSLSWTEAQTYCRQKHTDLAIIETSEEMDQLMNAVSSAGYSSDFWIGLYNEIAWRWSDGFTGSFTGYTYWSPEDPFHSRSDQICMTAHWYFVYLYSTDVNGTKIYKGNKNLTTWRDSNCKTNMTFICYSGTQKNPEYVFVNERMNWSSAQRYCRHNFTDLATFRSDDDWKKIPNLAPLDQKSWIGLYRDSNISWSDGNNFFFYKTPIYLSLQPHQITARCGGQHVRNTHDWYFHVCESRFPFVCYRGTQQNPDYVFVNERMNWSSAQRYCRENFTDLATLRNDTDWMKLYSVIPANLNVWTGLYRDSNITWSDGNSLSFYQKPTYLLIQPGVTTARCGFQYVHNTNYWHVNPCEYRYPFVCYGPPKGTRTSPVYVFVNETMNWSSAQTYCRNNFADLVTVESASVWTNIRNAVAPNRVSWIGLYRNSNISWSDGSNFFFYQQPTYLSYWPGLISHTCGYQYVNATNRWYFLTCAHKFPFVCYGPSKEIFILSSCLHIRQYHFVHQPLKWTQAQTYCRQKHTDLATIETSEEMDRVMNTVSSAGYSSKFWTGLYSNIKWRWSDGFAGVFNDHNYWSSEDSFHSRSDQICMVSKGHDLYVSWSDLNCSSLLPFVCYYIKKRVVTLRLKTENSDILNDAAVKLKLLEKLQEKLKENGVSGVEVKWRQTTDGKVFNQEKKKKTEL